jgi:hypothetical protein
MWRDYLGHRCPSALACHRRESSDLVSRPGRRTNQRYGTVQRGADETRQQVTGGVPDAANIARAKERVAEGFLGLEKDVADRGHHGGKQHRDAKQ